MQPITEVSKCLNISRRTISTLLKQFQNGGTVVRRPSRQDRKLMTTAQEDRYSALTTRISNYKKSTFRQLISELLAATGIAVSRQTV